MSNLCQTDYEAARPGTYFPTTFRTGECDACEEQTFVARAAEKDVREAKYARFAALPIAPENPEKLRGPELGARVRYTGSSEYLHGQIGTVTARSYVWAPDKQYGEHRGVRRYDDSVVQFDNGKSSLVLDQDLEEVG